MNTILVSYDLNEKGKDYSKIIEHLESYEEHIKPLLSLWLIRTPLTAKEVYDKVEKCVDKNDNICAIDVTGSLLSSKWKVLQKDVELIKKFMLTPK